jgi:hypothetical protein
VRDSIPATRFSEVSRGFFENIFEDLGYSRRETRESGVSSTSAKSAKFLRFVPEKKVLEFAPASSGDQKRVFGTL